MRSFGMFGWRVHVWAIKERWPKGTQCMYCGTTELKGGSGHGVSWKPLCKPCNEAKA